MTIHAHVTQYYMYRNARYATMQLINSFLEYSVYSTLVLMYMYV